MKTSEADMKTSELTGVALDWAVAKCEGLSLYKDAVLDGIQMDGWYVAGYYMDPNAWIRLGRLRYSADWAQGGPIIERELIDVQAKFNSGSDIVPKGKWYWQASTVNEDDIAYWFDGPTPLIAAMRCYVASKLGDDVDIPKELT